MLSKAGEWRPIKHVPKIKMSKTNGRGTLIDSKTERALLDGLSEPVNQAGFCEVKSKSGIFS
jgi:hypothetical protein